MRKAFIVGCMASTLAAWQEASAQAGISLGAAVGSVWHDNKLSGDELHGLVYLRIGVPLVPYAARGDLFIFDQPDADYDVGLIGSAVMSVSLPLIQPYAIAGIGRYGLGDGGTTGLSFGAGVRVGGRRGLFLEGRRHEPINRTLVSLGIAF
ncbi:MAG: hypothetical protein ACT4P6_22625 [Gemmatimonadaceae bacterium]